MAPEPLGPDGFTGAIVAGMQGGVAILLATGSSADLEAVLDLLLEQLRPPGRQSSGEEECPLPKPGVDDAELA
jgi:hypothetical protein